MDATRDWVEALRGPDATATLTDLSDYLRRTLARGFSGQLSDADLADLTQESVMRVLDKLDTFEGKSRFTTWATASAVNHTLGALRKRRHAHVTLEAAVAAGADAIAPDAASAHGRSQRDRALYAAIEAALTDRQREALLARLSGLPMAALADKLGTSPGALYKMLHDARRRLRQHFEDQGIGPEDLLGLEEDAQ